MTVPGLRKDGMEYRSGMNTGSGAPNGAAGGAAGRRTILSLAGFVLTGAVLLTYAIVYGVYYVSAEAGSDLFAPGGTPLLLLNTAACYLVVMPIAASTIGFIRKKTMSYPAAAPGKLSAGPFVVCCVCFALVYGGTALGQIFDSLFAGVSGGGGSAVELPGDAAGIAVYAFSILVAAPIAEELLFRRSLCELLRPFGERMAAAASALLFAAFHASIGQFFYAFAAGLLFGYVYLKTGRLRYTVILHIAVNLFAGLLPLLIDTFLLDREAVAQAYGIMSEWLSGGGASVMPAAEVIELLGPQLPGLAAETMLMGVFRGMALAGVFMSFPLREKISLKKGPLSLGKGETGYTFFLAPGILVFLTVSIALTILSYYI